MDASVSNSFTILIVDDNLQNLQILGKILKESKYEIEFAIDGETAFEWLESKKFDLILLDINMPGMNGFEVCTKIRLDPKHEKLPIIFLSSESERKSILKGFEVGAQDYVTKPFDKRELLVRVKTHLTLKKSHETLMELNLSLEKKVQERTQELTEANKKLEAANLKLEELDNSKTEFMHMISHELRTPLNGMVGPIYLLKEMDTTAGIVSLVEVIDRSVRRLEKFSLIALLITELRTMGEKMPKKSMLLVDLINNSIADKGIVNQLQQKNIQLLVDEISPENKIIGNFDLLKTCINNILENAIEYSNTDSYIKIKNKKVDDLIILEIEDEGSGFSENSVAQINNMLASKDLIVDFKVGLGLNLVKFIMANHSGKVEVANINNGASVSLFFNPI